MEGDTKEITQNDKNAISIHSLRMEGDSTIHNIDLQLRYFNPLPPHGGRHKPVKIGYIRFHFNPLPPHGGRPNTGFRIAPRLHFNPLPPHGGRRRQPEIKRLHIYFNPLPPHGGRRRIVLQVPCMAYFNPLPPHGGRPMFRVYRSFSSSFQSTPSAWRETDDALVAREHIEISIHSLRMEGDFGSACTSIWVMPFQSTPSAWRETKISILCYLFSIFQSTPSAWRETSSDRNYIHSWSTFQSTPSAWRETQGSY